VGSAEGAVAASSPHEFLDAPPGRVLEVLADREGREHEAKHRAADLVELLCDRETGSAPEDADDEPAGDRESQEQDQEDQLEPELRAEYVPAAEDVVEWIAQQPGEDEPPRSLPRY